MRSLLALWVLSVALSSLEPEVKGVEEDYCCSAGIGEELWIPSWQFLEIKERLDK